MKRILIPTDFSEHAADALKVAAQIAKKNNCEIHLLHMLELPIQMSDTVTGESSIPEVMLFIKKTNELFKKIKEQPSLKGITVVEATKFERASEGILSYSKKNNIDLIIMGSHGSSGFEEILIGSNTEKVVRFSEIPVLVIKKDMGEFKTQNFVFASDFSKEINKPFKKLIELASIFDSNLYLVMICTPSSFKTTQTAEKIMTNFVSEFKIKNYSKHIYNDANIEQGILNFANSVDADLIGTCTHGRTGFSHFFNGSTGEDLVNHTIKPVISFKI